MRPTDADTRRRVTRQAIAAVVLLVVGGFVYAWYHYRFPKWREEVLLPDGRKIVVQERRDFIEGYGTRRTWLTFSLPEMGGERTWSEWLYPTMIGAADGAVYVIGRPRGSRQFSMYSYPRYVYVAYQWRGERFERVPLMSVPEHLRLKENVRWCLPGGEDSKRSVRDHGRWCVERIGRDDKFPMAQVVDLPLRSSEAKFWAELDGHRPGSE